MIHDFEECNAYSFNPNDDDFWMAFYRKAFPTMVDTHVNNGDLARQYEGIDRVLILSSGRKVFIDEKKQPKDWPCILLEYISNDVRQTPGWIEKDLRIDYIAYAFMESRRIHLYPWILLKSAWNEYGQEWKERFRNIHAENYGRAGESNYTTWSVAVPFDELEYAITQQFRVYVPGDWSDNK